MAQITVELPDHLVEEFIGWMSNSGEQVYMEDYQMQDDRNGQYVSFDYPDWKDKIVITEHKE